MRKSLWIVLALLVVGAAQVAHADTTESFNFSGILAQSFMGSDSVTGTFTLDLTKGTITAFDFTTPVITVDASNGFLASILTYTPAVNPNATSRPGLSCVSPILATRIPGVTRNRCSRIAPWAPRSRESTHPIRRTRSTSKPQRGRGPRSDFVFSVAGLTGIFSAFEIDSSGMMFSEGSFAAGAAPELLSVVEENKIDLIVLGTRGRSGVGKFFLGSVAEEIFRRAPCAVMTIGPRSAGESSRRRKISEIVYATNFSTESVAAASYALSLAQEFQAHLTLLHVIANEEPDDLVHSRELVKSAEHLLRNLIPSDAELWCEPGFAVEQGSPAEKILEVANRRKADLIVLGVHRPSGFTGAATHLPIATAHKVVSNAPCPVLTARG